MSEYEGPEKQLLLTPEYWDGHSKDDSCGEKSYLIHPLDQLWKAEKRGREILKKFLQLPDKNVVRIFNHGDCFNPDSLPDESILKIDSEELFVYDRVLTVNPSSDKSSYRNLSVWAVICRYKDIEIEKQAALAFHQGKLSNIIKTPLQIGETYHFKGSTNQLLRVNRVELIKSGKPIPREILKKSFVFNPGTIFQPPHPEPVAC